MVFIVFWVNTAKKRGTQIFPYFLKERKNHALIVPAALWSSGLRRNPLKVESRVRFPAGSPITHIDIRKDVFYLL